MTPFMMRYGHFLDKNGAVIDEVTAVYMPAGKSYTGLDQVEIFCHGGRQVALTILNEIVSSGARAAEPGEFTKLAFLSGRIDLTRAEAVAEIIGANTTTSYQAAREHLLGAYSEHINKLRQKIIDIISEVEASIDFPEEDVDTLETRRLIESVDETIRSIKELAQTYTGGRIIREGYTIAIAGRPNAGKSSLFNLLLRQERALVTPTPGTTRDYLSEWIDLGGFAVELIDTAGLRGRGGPIEKAGQKSAMKIVSNADLVLWMVDLSEPDWTNKLGSDSHFVRKYPNLLVGNKIDLLKTHSKQTVSRGNIPALRRVGACPQPTKRQGQALPLRGIKAKEFVGPNPPKAGSSDIRKSEPRGFRSTNGQALIPISCLTGKGINNLKKKLLERINEKIPDLTSGVVVTSARHQQKLKQAVKHLRAAKKKMSQSDSPELTAFNLRQAANAIDEITGKVYTEDILQRIFSKFCIGK
jgi:tRNA modification GTPase